MFMKRKFALFSRSRALAAAILDMLDKHRVQDQTIVTSFHFDALLEVKAMAPGQRVGWLVRTGGFNADNMAKAAKAGFHQLCPMAGETTKDLVRDGHARVADFGILRDVPGTKAYARCPSPGRGSSWRRGSLLARDPSGVQEASMWHGAGGTRDFEPPQRVPRDTALFEQTGSWRVQVSTEARCVILETLDYRPGLLYLGEADLEALLRRVRTGKKAS